MDYGSKDRLTVAVIAALPQEASVLVKDKLTVGEITEISPWLFLGISGIGYQAAKEMAYGLIPRKPTIVISWGTAVALKKELRPGTVLLPELVVDEDGIKFSTDPYLNQTIKDLLYHKNIPFDEGRLYGQAPLLGTPENKRDLYRKTGASAADMESAAIAAVARENDLPFIAVRVVADGINTRLPHAVITASSDDGVIDPMQFLWTVSKSPKDWIPTMQLAIDFFKAKRSLKYIGANWNMFIKDPD